MSRVYFEHETSNFHGMLAIVSALSHPSVNRLTETWSRINAKDRKTFENLQKFAPEQEGRQLLQSIFQQIKVCYRYVIQIIT